MADSAITKWTARPVVSYALRYGLAFASVTGALLLELLFRYFNLPHPFAAFALSAIALTFWYAGTKPGILAVLLSSLTRGFLFEAETSSLSRVLYDLVFLLFALLMIWVRRTRHTLELTVADRTAKLIEANEQLQRQKEQLDRLFELSPVAVILADENFQVLRVNQEFTHLFGYPLAEAQGRPLYELIVPEEFQEDTRKNMALVLSGERVNLESIRRRKDGVRLDVSITVAPLAFASGQKAIYLMYRDITERKKAERKLQRSEANLLESQRLMHMCSWAYDPSTGMVTFSPEVKRIYDIKSDQDTWTTDFLLDRLHPEDRPVVEGIVRRALLGKTDYDASYRIVLPDGSIKHIHSIGHPVLNESGELVELLGTSVDITEQWKARAELEEAFEEIKQRTEAARRSERELRDVVNTVPAHVWRTSPQGQVDFVNDRWLEFTGLALEEAFGWKWEAVVHPDDRTRVVADWRTAIRNGQAIETEARVRRADGEYCWWFIRNVPLRDETGKLVKWYGTAIDINDRKRAEQALQKSEERWRSVFENSAIGVALTDLNGRFLATNHVYQRMVGYTEEELRALSFLDLTHADYREAHWALVTELLEEKRRQFQMEKKYLRKDGSSIWVRNNISLVPGTETVPRFIMALSEDITERKRAEEALQRSQSYLAGAERLSHTGSWAVQVPSGAAQVPELKMVHWSEEMFRIFCIDPGPMPPSHIERAQRLHPEDVARHHAIVSQAILDRTDFDTDYRLLLPNGTTKYIHAVGHPVLNASGDVVELVGTAMDVTERKQAEEALRRSERDLLEAQRISHTGSWKHDVSSGTVTVSPEVFRIFGVKPDEDTSTPEFWLSRNHPEDQKRIQELFERCEIEKTNYDADYRIVLPDGAIKHLHAVGRPILNQSGDLVEFIGTVVDITERKQSEEALRRSEAYLAEAQRLTHTGSWAWNVRTDALFWSQEIFRIYDCNPEMTPTWDFLLERVHPEDRSNLERRKQMESTQKEWADSEIDFRIVRPDGTIKHLHSIAHPVMDQSGEIAEVVGTVIDVTERKRAEEALHRSEAYLAEAQRLTHTGSWAYKAGGEGYWSEENFGIWGFDPGQGAPDLETLLQRIHPEDRDRVREYRVKAVQARQDYELEFRIVLPSGTLKHIQVLAHPVFSGSGELIEVVGTHVDVTERKRAEEERERLRQLEADLAHMNRLTMLGELASSLAHELNQPITAAITSATACLRWLARNPPDMERARAAAVRIEKDGSRAAEIIQRLRAFYKTGAPPQRELLDLNEVASEMLALLQNEASRHSVSLRTELTPQLPKIMADRVQLQQVLMNLMLNGIEAITDGAGELTIRSQSAEDGLLLISVSDTGVGIPSETLDQIFNAFYTTKPQGTGMGLAISRSIIEAHGGRLWATANVERGATFHFTLPAELQR